MNPKVSIIIITYNHEKYISQTIESVLNQACNYNFEIIIGEDYSTDSTRKIIYDYSVKYPEIIKPFFPEKNIGAIANEQNCLKIANGQYIAFLEGDDFWINPLKLQKQIDFLEANPDFGIVHADVNHYYESTGKTEFSVNKANGIKAPEGNIFSELLKPEPFFIKTATVCFRKELAINYFDYDQAIKENWPITDLPMWIDISYHSKAHYIDEVFATYRLLNESASRTQSHEKKLKYHNALFKIKQTYLKKYNCDEKFKKDLEENYHRGIIRIAFNLNDINLIKESINYLNINKLKISTKERVMILSVKNKVARKIIAFIRK